MLEVTHHSGKKIYINPEYVVTVRTLDSGATEILLMAGPPLSCTESATTVMASLGHLREDVPQIEYEENAE